MSYDSTKSLLQSIPRVLETGDDAGWDDQVRTMVIAIRHKDQARALESGKAALAELKGTSLSAISGGHTEPSPEASVVRQQETPAGKESVFGSKRNLVLRQ